MKVQSFVGIPPETQAYAMAKYSRSSQSMEESLQEINADKSAKFLDTFYFQYGHASIADLAHLTFAVEDISILAAIELEDESLWDGQERSTRYQDFRKSGYIIPHELDKDPAAIEYYAHEMDALFDAYFKVSSMCLDILKDLYPIPENMAESAYVRTLRARAFDVARYLLPLATKTSVGQIVNARTLERQISRLLTNETLEIRELALDLRNAALYDANTPLCTYDTPVRAAPTLVKHVGVSAYQKRLQGYFRELASTVPNNDLTVIYKNSGNEVTNVPSGSYRSDILAGLLYSNDPLSRPFWFWVNHVDLRMSVLDTEKHLNFAISARGPYDELAREYKVGYPLNFDLLTDIGAYRDLHRHRRCVQLRPPLTFDLGFGSVSVILAQGLGQHAQFNEVADVFINAMTRIAEAAKHFEPRVQQYMLPLGYRMRSLFKMDLAEAGYITELRTKPAGHFSYRQVAWDMYKLLEKDWSDFAQGLRVTNPNEIVDMFNR